MNFWIKALTSGAVGCLCLSAMAQTDNSNLSKLAEASRIEAQRLVLADEKKKVLDQFQDASKACWQQFAVNDCLFKARQQKYQSLNPLDQREIDLNIRQRALKELERLQRLSDKSIEAPKDKAVP